MIEKKVVKTVRFKEEEIRQIEVFLSENPALDFSTMIRLAVGKFISTPTLNSIEKNNVKAASAGLKESLWN